MFHLGHNERHVRGYIESLAASRLTNVSASDELVQGITRALDEAGPATGKPMQVERFSALQTLILRVADLIDLAGTRTLADEKSQLPPSVAPLRARRRLTTDCAIIANTVISPAERLDFAGWLFATSSIDPAQVALLPGPLAHLVMPVYAGGTIAPAQILPGLILRSGGHVDHSIDQAHAESVRLVEKAIYQAGVARFKAALTNQPALTASLEQAIGQLKTA